MTDAGPFITRWSASSAHERANYALFLSELCDLLGVPRPNPAVAEDRDNAFVFERAVTFAEGRSGRIDLYKRGCFVLEAKQASTRGTKGWSDSMLRARAQAEGYVHALSTDEPAVPFLLVCDIGHVLEVFADFTGTNRVWNAYPEAGSHRIPLASLADPAIQSRLRTIFTNPGSLDPSRRAAKATRASAEVMANLAKRLEAQGHAPDLVAAFLMRCLFTMFAEDVALLPHQTFTNLLLSLKGHPHQVAPILEDLWKEMDAGGFSRTLRCAIPRFNGHLFKTTTALPIDTAALDDLIRGALEDWSEVEPAIFGTLLERALDPTERHALGAHFTPRAYVDRLLEPTLAPLRDDWQNTRTAAVALASKGKVAEAVGEIEDFLRDLAKVRILDPACGSGNFLYAAFAALKRLDTEAHDLLTNLGQGQQRIEVAGISVHPRQFLGLEVNPRAARIADLVLWIGALQQHFQVHGRVWPAEPVLTADGNIRCQDACIAWDAIEPTGQTRWDGVTMKLHPVTGEEVPDETATVAVVRYVNPRPAPWPEAEFIVGNPPFIGAGTMRAALGDGYVEAVRAAHPNLPESIDFVMYWWHRAAQQVRAGTTTRFGLITTNSIKQTFNRRVIQDFLAPADGDGATSPASASPALAFAVPDHPWIDGHGGAAVRVAMTVGALGTDQGRLALVSSEATLADGTSQVQVMERTGVIHADLTTGADLTGIVPLQANAGLACRGMQIIGAGFIVTPEEAKALGLGREPGLERIIKPYRNGRDLTDRPREVLIIDAFGWTAEDLRAKHPATYQHLLDHVKPERDTNARATYRDNWWIFGEARRDFRPALKAVSRYVTTVETAKHRVFQFLSVEVVPDNKLIAIAADDGVILGVMSSKIHGIFALRTGSTLEDRPVYPKSACFDPFPFPDATPAQRTRIATLAESLDAHRKRQQAAHPGLTLTGMYNVLAALREGRALTDKERTIHDQGLVGILRQLHDDLDAAVAEAYGWPVDLPEDEVLTRLVALNRTRAEEEVQGHIRWLRPDLQAPTPTANPRSKAAAAKAAAPVADIAKAPWPKRLRDRVAAVRGRLTDTPQTDAVLAKGFLKAKAEELAEVLATLEALGLARQVTKGWTLA